MRSPACWTMPVTTSPWRSTYSSYMIARSASRIRCWMTCFAVCAAMRPKSSGVTSVRTIWSGGTCDQSRSRSSSATSVCWRSPVSSSIRSSSAMRASRASSTSRNSMSSGISIPNTRNSPSPSSLTSAWRVASGRLLVRREQRVLERGDEDAFLDPLLLLDRLDAFDDLLAHVSTPRRSDWPARWRRTGCAALLAGRGERDGAVLGPEQLALEAVPALDAPVRANGHAPADSAAAKCCGLRSGRSGPGEETSIV